MEKNLENTTEQQHEAQRPVIKSFACLDDEQKCDKQCNACKFVEEGLKKLANSCLKNN